MCEKKIELAVCTYAKQKNVYSYKLINLSQKGFPDRAFFYKNGIVFYIEFKSKKGKLTLLQEKMINLLSKFILIERNWLN